MKYAIIASGGKQYRVKEGDIVEVDSLSLKPQSQHTFSDVLLLVDNDVKKIGKPMVEGASVIGSVIEEKKGEKIRVAKFKAKARYRKVIGFRHSLSKIKIDKIVEKEKK